MQTSQAQGLVHDHGRALAVRWRLMWKLRGLADDEMAVYIDLPVWGSSHISSTCTYMFIVSICMSIYIAMLAQGWHLHHHPFPTFMILCLRSSVSVSALLEPALIDPTKSCQVSLCTATATVSVQVTKLPKR